MTDRENSRPDQDGIHSADELRVDTEGAVRVLTINRPRRKNALSGPMRQRLTEEFLAVRLDDSVRVVVLTGTGDTFCAGADLKELAAQPPGHYRGPLDRVERPLCEVVAETYKPVIAALNGPAVGAGYELALACDLRIATDRSTLTLPEARLGMGAFFATVVLPRRLPLGLALELLYTGDPMSAAEALRWGLVNRVVGRQELLATALELANRIAGNAPLTIRRMKENALKGLDLPLGTALRLDAGPDPYSSADRTEGLAAFRLGREPNWDGR